MPVLVLTVYAPTVMELLLSHTQS